MSKVVSTLEFSVLNINHNFSSKLFSVGLILINRDILCQIQDFIRNNSTKSGGGEPNSVNNGSRRSSYLGYLSIMSVALSEPIRWRKRAASPAKVARYVTWFLITQHGGSLKHKQYDVDKTI